MTKLVQRLPGGREGVMEGLTLEVLAELPVQILHRVVSPGGALVMHRGQLVVKPDDEESAKWITTTLNHLGIPVVYWP